MGTATDCGDRALAALRLVEIFAVDGAPCADSTPQSIIRQIMTGATRMQLHCSFTEVFNRSAVLLCAAI
jgi:hypothetical protein